MKLDGEYKIKQQLLLGLKAMGLFSTITSVISSIHPSQS